MKKIISLILIAILSLPSIFGLNHYLKEDHNFHFEETTHFHEGEINCSVCDYARLSIEFKTDDYNYSIKEYTFSKARNTFYNQINFSIFSTYFDSRGPPFNS